MPSGVPTRESDEGLHSIVLAWPQLPDAVRRAIVALISAVRLDSSEQPDVSISGDGDQADNGGL